MITKPKLRIERGQVYLCKRGGELQELHVVDVVKSEQGSAVKHQYKWDSLEDFAAMNPKLLGRTRKFLGVRCGVIRGGSSTAQPSKPASQAPSEKATDDEEKKKLKALLAEAKGIMLTQEGENALLRERLSESDAKTFPRKAGDDLGTTDPIS